MQISLHKAFMKRVLFNACKVYSRQLPIGSHFENLQPVHCLCILNNTVDADTPEFIQSFHIAKANNPSIQMEGIHFHFVELTKFMENSKFELKNPLHAWMKFFTNPEYFSTMPIKHYETFDELKKAIELLDESNFTEAQLYAYDKYLDNIRTQKAIEDYQMEKGMEKGMKKGMEMGIEKGMEKGIEIGIEKGLQMSISIFKDLQSGKLSPEEIALKYSIPKTKIEKLAAEFE
jgi:predicted transposase/invertase (TIGR01784 family)